MVFIFHAPITFERPLRYRDYEYEALWLVSTSNIVIPNLDSSFKVTTLEQLSLAEFNGD